ncbi:hypothetical protein LguiA_029900 [Lonicera macranthoides]
MPPGPRDIEKGSTDGEEWAKGKIMKSETYRNGYTPLHEAVRSHHVDVVKMLIEEDPEYSYTPKKYIKESRETPLYLAARRGFDELVDMILKKCKSPACSGPNGKTTLHGAVISNNKRCVELLLNWRTNLVREEDYNYQTPLHVVAHLGYADLVSSLLLSDKSVAYIKDYESNTAIHIAANRGHISVLKEIMSQCPNSWNMVGCNYQTILHMAVKYQQKNVIEYILKECPIIDALINQEDYKGNTPLHLLCMSNYYLPQLILYPMADKGVSNYDIMTPLDLVTNNVDMPMATKLMVAFVTGIYAVLSNSLALAIATCTTSVARCTFRANTLATYVQEHSSFQQLRNDIKSLFVETDLSGCAIRYSLNGGAKCNLSSDQDMHMVFVS